MMKIARYKESDRVDRGWIHEVRLVADVPTKERFVSEAAAIAVAMSKASILGGDVTVWADGELVGTAVGDRVTGSSVWRQAA